jgi:hypothetical protein
MAFLILSRQMLGWKLDEAKIDSFEIFFSSSYFGLCVVLTPIRP